MENAGAVTFTETYVFRQQGDRRDQGASRRHDPARARPHVVRRPRHHEVVERPLAERVVRGVGVDDRDRRGHRVDRGVDDVQRDGEDLGLPPGPAALDPPGRRRDQRPRGRAGQLRRHHLRQGRLGAQAARRLGRHRRVLRRRRGSTSRSTSGATPSCRDLLAELETTSGRELATWAKKWLETAGVNTLAPEIATDAHGIDHAFRDRCRRPRPTTRRSARTASASASTTLQATALWCACTTSSSTSTATSPRCPSSRGTTRPDLVLLNDEDLAYAKIRLDARSLADGDRAPRRASATRSRARSCGARRGIRRGMPRPRRATTSTSCCATSAARPSRRPSARRSPSCSSPRTRTSRPEKRDATRAKVADGLWALAQAAEAGSDSQLQFVTAFAHRGSTPGARGSTVRRVRDGEVDLRRASRSTPTCRGSCSISLAAGGVVDAKPTSTRPSRPTTPRRAASSPRRPRRRSRPPRRSRPRGTRSSTTTTCRTRSCAPRRSGFSTPPASRCSDEFVAAVLRDAAADLELAHATRSRSTSSSGLYPAAAREHRRCATRRAPGSRPTRDAARGAAPPRRREPRGRRARARGPGSRRALVTPVDASHSAGPGIRR